VRLHSAEYREWWATYEEGGLRIDQSPPELLKALAAGAGVVVASTRRRALESARAVIGERDLLTDPMFIEAPLPPPRFPSYLKFSPRTWGVIARFWWWFFDHHEGQETRDQAKERARRAAAQLVRLAEDGRDVMVFAHGFFNGMVGIELTRQGWRCVKDQGFRYWSARRFERR
jgi:broad specificity phosphatase PhoE